MPHAVKVIADSISPVGARLTTLEVTFPRIILAEFNTHRVFSRNSASSRAIPVERMLQMVRDDPYIPTHWGKNQKGMQAEEELSAEEQYDAKYQWLSARDEAIYRAVKLKEIGVHKQITNRLLEPFLWHTALVTSTEWENWDHLRDNKAAHPEIQKLARLMKEARESSKPRELQYGEWHLPYISLDEQECLADLLQVSTGRCARLSYLTHDGVRAPQKDVELHDSLLVSGHMSPFEHCARPMTGEELAVYYMRHLVLEGGVRVDTRDTVAVGDVYSQDGKLLKVVDVFCTYFCGNFDRWVQYRKQIPYEHDLQRPR